MTVANAVDSYSPETFLHFFPTVISDFGKEIQSITQTCHKRVMAAVTGLLQQLLIMIYVILLYIYMLT